MIYILKRIFGQTPDQIMDQAITRASLLSAEVEKFRVSKSMYELLLQHTDPHTDWWRFADLKQKHLDVSTEYKFLLEHSLIALDVVGKLRGTYYEQTLSQGLATTRATVRSIGHR